MHNTEKITQVGLKNVFLNFIRSESFGGIFLFISAVLAMIVANSPLSEYYFNFWHIDFGFSFGQHFVGFSIHHWINDVLMALFFLMVGLEIKREVLFGELAGFKKAAFPAIAALGGMIIPGLIYYSLNAGTNSYHGFGIPMATDIAFALGVIMLLGKKVPMALKVFLVTLAVADDLGAIIVIAVFYTSGLNLTWLIGAGVIIVLLIFLNKIGIKNLLPYLILGVLLWFAIHNSGIHATIAAVILAFTIPITPKRSRKNFTHFIRELADQFQIKVPKNAEVDSPSNTYEIAPLSEDQIEVLESIQDRVKSIRSPLGRLEHFLQPYSAYFIMPLFAFANAGVNIGNEIHFDIDHIVLGVVLGLVIGKPIGIFFITFLCEKLRIASRPEGISWGHIVGAGMLAGIGFTMSMFVSNLAFSHPESMEVSKISILIGSLISGIIGVLYLNVLYKLKPKEN
ncbi:sodium/proton antiporter NhaA [Helicobacter cappadocius]|uniref:Na(+)/H(+) antiporter NhaA n=1 Tax=Helicobacter cappadocius TaxID=3063998 RepID=A0AA90PW11_9HELI|nr:MULTISPECIES: sodium/proton antiporter NhaA [unclassified Helicobacter]MDO7253431.1 sodium/proton antiporter NhaA [Helicobacter sp. faydin-H75]MDP2539305.1 sodium/proton antiporter NhaA [Helicobacter sp. faydin-H76]